MSSENLTIEKESIALLQELMGEDFSELVTVFIRDAEQRIEQIKQLIEQQDAAQLADIVHGLKGSAMNLSATQLSNYSQQLEQQSRAGDLTQAEQLIGDIEQAYQQVKEYLLRL